MELKEQQIVDRFIELVQIDSVSYQERPMADFLKRVMMEEFGCDVMEDDAGQKTLQNLGQETKDLLAHTEAAGNLICNLKGNAEGAPPLTFVAHMDTVVSKAGVKVINENGVIRTDGKTILGADDRAGIAAILEALRAIKDNNMQHGDLQVIFTIGEETGLYGSLYLDREKIQGQYAFVLDSGGPPDTIIVAAPTEIDFTVHIYGKAAHSGVNPEDGLNAISVAAEAISKLRLGRIDDETTVNIGVIQGGEKTNIVCDRVEILGEARSRNKQKLTHQIAKIRNAFEMAGEKWSARFDIQEETIYDGFSLTENDEVVRLAMEGVRRAGLNPTLTPRGGGSDTNHLNAKGIPAVNLGVGATDDHTVNERVQVQDLVNATRLVLGIIQTAAERAGVQSS